MLTQVDVTTTREPAIGTEEKIAGIVAQILGRRSITKNVAVDDDLRQIGLTSLDMVNLMLAVEAEFDLRIPEAAMTLENFRSISAIDALVAASRLAA